MSFSEVPLNSCINTNFDLNRLFSRNGMTYTITQLFRIPTNSSLLPDNTTLLSLVNINSIHLHTNPQTAHIYLFGVHFQWRSSRIKFHDVAIISQIRSINLWNLHPKQLLVEKEQ